MKKEADSAAWRRPNEEEADSAATGGERSVEATP
jgi:hypothetical protein